MDDSRFAVIVFLLMVALGAAVGYACRAIEMSGFHQCAATLVDGVGNKHQFLMQCEVLNDE